MKKNLLIIIGILIIAVIVVILVILLNKPKYLIKVTKVDDQSPDRVLTVYNKNEKVDFKRIEFLEGKLLCTGINSVVHFGNIKDVDELRVIFKDESEVIARVVKEEVE